LTLSATLRENNWQPPQREWAGSRLPRQQQEQQKQQQQQQQVLRSAHAILNYVPKLLASA